MKVIFMGTPEFSVGTFNALIEAGHEIVLAVTQPDKKRGRGKEVQLTPVKEAALMHHIPVYQPEKIRDPQCVKYLKEYKADIMVVVAFGQILPKEILNMTSYGAVNVHASLLPKYRGAAPIQWAIINGEEVTGVTTMQMDEGLDTGDMIEKVIVKIEKDETGGSLHDKLAKAGARLCVETLVALKEKTAKWEPQEESTTSYAKMLQKELGNIDWNQPAIHIERLIRGLSPWPSAYTMWENKVLKIWKAKVKSGDYKKPVGTIVEVEKDLFWIQTTTDLLGIEEMQLPGKRRIEAGAFLRGHSVAVGKKLGGDKT